LTSPPTDRGGGGGGGGHLINRRDHLHGARAGGRSVDPITALFRHLGRAAGSLVAVTQSRQSDRPSAGGSVEISASR